MIQHVYKYKIIEHEENHTKPRLKNKTNRLVMTQNSSVMGGTPKFPANCEPNDPIKSIIFQFWAFFFATLISQSLGFQKDI